LNKTHDHHKNVFGKYIHYLIQFERKSSTPTSQANYIHAVSLYSSKETQ